MKCWICEKRIWLFGIVFNGKKTHRSCMKEYNKLIEVELSDSVGYVLIKRTGICIHYNESKGDDCIGGDGSLYYPYKTKKKALMVCKEFIEEGEVIFP